MELRKADFMFNKKVRGMTYVELVLVLTIVGVISSLTLPALKKYSQRSELGELGRKAYANIEDSIDNAILHKGPMRNWDFSSNTTFFNEYIEPNVNHTALDAANANLVTNDTQSMTVQDCDGAVCFILVDVNNTKAPNLAGKDTFKFKIDKTAEKVIPDSYGGTDELARNGWKFTDTHWNTAW